MVAPVPDAVYTASKTTTGTTLSCTTGAVPVGKKIIVACVRGDVAGNAATVSVADSRGNTYTLDAYALNNGTGAVAVFSAQVTTALLAGDTITATWGASQNRNHIAAHVYTGLKTTGRDATNNATATANPTESGGHGNGTTATGTTGVTTDANGLTFAALCATSGAGTPTPGSGYTGTGVNLNTSAGSSDRRMFCEAKTTTATGAQTATATIAAVDWAIAVAHYPAVAVSNISPTANAGTDQADVEPYTAVSLSGTDSDTDGTIASRLWTQTGGASVVLRATPLINEPFDDLANWGFDPTRFSIVDGQVRATTGTYSQLTYNTTFDMTGKALEFAADWLTTDVGISHEFYVSAKKDVNNEAYWLFTPGDGNVFARTIVGGVQTQGTLALPTRGTKFRIRFSGTSVLFQTSGDGVTWTTAFTHTAAWAATPTGMTTYMMAGNWQVEAETAECLFDFLRVQSLTANAAGAEFLAPGTVAGDTLTFQYQVTDNLGATGADTASVTVLPAAERILIGGTWTPARVAIV